MSVGHTYMHGYFPAPDVPKIPADFNYWIEARVETEEDGEGEDQDEDGDEGQEADYAHQNEMDERDYRFYAEMYES